MARTLIFFFTLLFIQVVLAQPKQPNSSADTLGNWAKVIAAEKLAEAGQYKAAMDTLQKAYEVYLLADAYEKSIKTDYEIIKIAIRTQDLKLALEYIDQAQNLIQKNRLSNPHILGEFAYVKGPIFTLQKLDSAKISLSRSLDLLAQKPGKQSMSYVHALDETGRLIRSDSSSPTRRLKNLRKRSRSF
ncbi:MAG: hypothetical protein R3B93_17720 [Bacteroidia bacterium]